MGAVNDTSKIEIPKNKTEVEFVIKNIGKLDVTYSFDENNQVEITPISGIIPVNNEVKIKIKIKNISDIFPMSDDIQSTLKQKSTKIYFKSNAGDKEILVTYYDI
ncbi:MAG: hypothetical protein PHZ25_03675 [Candidatus Pacebacteria bacterium]|nr:hypothetical protein [Candidatus Paceibacterota bacterium]